MNMVKWDGEAGRADEEEAKRVGPAHGSEVLPPKCYDPLLQGCCFGSVPVRGHGVLRAVYAEGTAGAGRSLLGVGFTKEEAAAAAARRLARRLGPAALELEDFREICLVATVEPGPGAPRGQLVPRWAAWHEQDRLLKAIMRSCAGDDPRQDADRLAGEGMWRGGPAFEQAWARVFARATPSTAEHIALAGGDHLILRAPGGPAPEALIERLHRQLGGRGRQESRREQPLGAVPGGDPGQARVVERNGCSMQG